MLKVKGDRKRRGELWGIMHRAKIGWGGVTKPGQSIKLRCRLALYLKYATCRLLWYHGSCILADIYLGQECTSSPGFKYLREEMPYAEGSAPLGWGVAALMCSKVIYAI